MFTVFSIMVAGVITGLYLRRFNNLKFISKLITGFIFLLLFFLGISVGNNPDIVNNLPTIGLQSIIITTGALAGSILAALFVYKRFFSKNDNNPI